MFFEMLPRDVPCVYYSSVESERPHATSTAISPFRCDTACSTAAPPRFLTFSQPAFAQLNERTTSVKESAASRTLVQME